MAKSTPAEPVPEQPAPSTVDAPESIAVWRYIGAIERLYSSVPVTVKPGDVLAWPTIPAEDDLWEPAGDATPTVVPDNAAPGAPRIWTPEELTYGWGSEAGHPALVEHWRPEDRPTEPAASSEMEVSGDA